MADRTTCRACGSALSTTLADLGEQPPANAYLSSVDMIASEKRYRLRVKVCETCKLAQLDYDVPPEELFHNYSYFSSYSDSWLAHARSYCDMARDRFALGSNSLVVELASNDGYLLKNFVSAGIRVLGIDPSDTVAKAAFEIGVPTLVEFFGTSVARRLADEGRRADLIIGNNVLAHVPDLNDFVAGIAVLLKPEGTVTMEFPHLKTLLEHVEFDTIYHEHFSYISLLAIESVFGRHGLRIFDVDELPTHGGSLRIFSCHAGRPGVTDSARLRQVRDDEMRAGLADLQTYARFAEKVETCRRSMRSFLGDAKAASKTVAAYGAAAKGNTLLNFCDVSIADLPMVADRSPHKQGKLLPGTHIPIVSLETMLAAQPDYVLILPWNLKTEIIANLDECRIFGAKFVTPIPTVSIHS